MERSIPGQAVFAVKGAEEIALADFKVLCKGIAGGFPSCSMDTIAE